MVTWENYEEYMLLDADGELNEDESKALQEFIGLHPELQKEYAMLCATVLEPETSIVYQHKETLLKKTDNVKRLPTKWWMYSAAATIAAILVIASIANRKDTVPELAEARPITNNHATTIPAPSKNIHSVPVKPVTIKTEVAYDKIPPAKRSNNAPDIKNQEINQTPIQQPLEALPATDIAYEIALDEPMIIPEPQIYVTNNAVNNTATNKENVFAILNKEKPAGITEFSSSLSQKIDKAKSLAQTIKSTDVVVRIGNHDLFSIQF